MDFNYSELNKDVENPELKKNYDVQVSDILSSVLENEFVESSEELKPSQKDIEMKVEDSNSPFQPPLPLQKKEEPLKQIPSQAQESAETKDLAPTPIPSQVSCKYFVGPTDTPSEAPQVENTQNLPKIAQKSPKSAQKPRKSKISKTPRSGKSKAPKRKRPASPPKEHHMVTRRKKMKEIALEILTGGKPINPPVNTPKPKKREVKKRQKAQAESWGMPKRNTRSLKKTNGGVSIEAPESQNLGPAMGMADPGQNTSNEKEYTIVTHINEAEGN